MTNMDEQALMELSQHVNRALAALLERWRLERRLESATLKAKP